MADCDDLEFLKERLIAARRNAVLTMAMERDRAVPSPGQLRLVADIEATLTALEKVYRETSSLPAGFHDALAG